MGRKRPRYGAPGEIRTPDLMLRRHSLYPAELRAHSPFRISHFAVGRTLRPGAPSMTLGLRYGLETTMSRSPFSTLPHPRVPPVSTLKPGKQECPVPGACV